MVASMEGQFISHWRILGWLFNPCGYATTQKSLLSWLSYSIAEKQKNPISRGHTQDVITAFPFNCLNLERPRSKHLVLWNPLQKQRLKQDLGYLPEKGTLVWRPLAGSQSQCSLLRREAMKTQEQHWIHICILDNALGRKTSLPT